MAALSRLTATGLSHLLQAPPPLFGITVLRSYRIAASAAAQPQLDCDGYYDCDRHGGIPAPVAKSEGSQLWRGVQWVFIGNPAAKRHLYAEMISKLLKVPYISITTLLRQDLSPRSTIYKQIAEAVNRGKLVPESIIFGLLSKRLEDGHDRGETGFILDGIPRTRLHAEILDKLVDIDLVVNFKCLEDGPQGRFPSNSSTSSDKAKTNFQSPDMAAVDAEPNVLSVYREQLKWLEDYYQNQNKLIDIQVENVPGETWKRLLAALHLQHINAVHSLRALTMGFRVS